MAITKKSLISSKPATKSTRKSTSIANPAKASKLVGASGNLGKTLTGASGSVGRSLTGASGSVGRNLTGASGSVGRSLTGAVTRF